MRIRTWLFLTFLTVPIVELVLFFYVGSTIGVWPTMALVVITAVLGSMLVSRQGRGTWNRLQREIATGQPPTATLVHGAMILVAGALLLTPGFLTDAIGFTLLIPGVREALRGWFVRRMQARWVIVK